MLAALLKIVAGTFADLPGWKKLLVRFSFLGVLAGGGWKTYQAVTPDDSPPSSRSAERADPATASRTDAELDGASRSRNPEPESSGLSGTLLQAGGAFLLAFFVGTMLRVFFKVSMLVGGGVALVLYGLSASGLVDLPFGSLSEATSAVSDWVSRHTEGLKIFLTMFLPQSGMSGVGLFSGFTNSIEDRWRTKRS